jgi:hypothetical protein
MQGLRESFKSEPVFERSKTMKEKIIKTSGSIWNALREKEMVEISRLPKMVNEKTMVVYQAIGWLAREDKIVYHTKGGKTYVSLPEHERSV